MATAGHMAPLNVPGPDVRHNLGRNKPSPIAVAAPDAESTVPRRPAPGEQLCRQKPVPARHRRHAITGNKALLHDPTLRIHAEPPATARVHDLQELEIITGLSGVHTTSNHINPKPSQGGLPRRLTEQIIAILKEQEAGAKAADVCRRHGISDATFYNWKARYGGLEVSQARRLKALEDENARLKKLLAEAMLDNAVLKDVAARKW
jgi:putative transposase